jgi:hypothetical protein
MRALLLLAAVSMHGATLDGTVSNAATGAPVKKARVTARGQGGSYQAVSDAAGRWSMPAMAEGPYELVVECQGFLAPTDRRRVRVPEEFPQSLVLTPLSVIAGKVLDEEGDPVPNVKIAVLAYDYTRSAPPLIEVGKSTTDDLGEYRVFDLKPGRYYVQSAAADKLLPVLYHSGALEIGQATPVDLAPGVETGGVDFRLRRTRMFRIRGTVTDAQTGEGMRAVVIAEGPAGAGPRYTAPSAEGGFEFPAVQPGTYRLSVTQNRGSREMWGERTVMVAGRDVDDVALPATPVVDVPGQVMVEGAPARSLNLRVTLQPADRPGFSASALPKSDGSFTVTATPQAHLVDIAGVPPDLYVRQIRFGAEDASAGRIDLRTGAAPLTIVMAGNPGSVAGTVERPGAMVAITPADPAVQRRDLARMVFADSEGSFTVGSLAPGEYRIFAWEQFDLALGLSFEFRRAMAAKAATVTVRAGQESTVQLRPIAQADAEDARRRMP